MIELVNVTHHYGVKPVLDDFNIRIETGEVVAVLGPNGMGKTTLLKLMAGILWPARGSVLIDGIARRSSEESEAEIRAKTIFLPDDFFFPSQVSIREFVLSLAKIYGCDEIDSMHHADRLFDLFALTDKADSAIGSCSTGQRKKAALCSALIANAPLMLLDEPFSGGLDPGGIVALKNILKRMSKSEGNDSRTVIFTTPVPEIISEVADRIAVVQDGRLAAFDTAEALCKNASEPTLEKAIDKLLHTDTLDRVERYFAETSKGEA